MSAMQTEVYEAFRAIDGPEDKALRAAAALSTAFAKRDVETEVAFDDRDGKITAIPIDMATIRVDLAALRDSAAPRSDLDALKVDQAIIEGDVALLKWMIGFLLAFAFKFLSRQRDRRPSGRSPPRRPLPGLTSLRLSCSRARLPRGCP